MNEAHAKINIALDITGIRPDGYHKVKMIMQQLSLHDDVTVTETDASGEDITLTVHGGGPDIPTDGRNIAVKAAKLMKETYGLHGSLHIDLVKRIPSAAGLAGGSADAAAVMKEIRDLYKKGLLHCSEVAPVLSDAVLTALSVKLGADVPYCILGGTALSEGIGEVLTPIPALPEIPVLLVKPTEGVSTKEVYTAYDAIADAVRHPDVDACVEDLAALRSAAVSSIRNPAATFAPAASTDAASVLFSADSDTEMSFVGSRRFSSAKTRYTGVDHGGFFQTLRLHTGDTADSVREAVSAEDLFRPLRLHTGNVLEEVTAAKLPVIREIEALMYEKGAGLSLMSGSGPTVFGFFENTDLLEAAAEKAGEHFPGFEIVKTTT